MHRHTEMLGVGCYLISMTELSRCDIPSTNHIHNHSIRFQASMVSMADQGQKNNPIKIEDDDDDDDQETKGLPQTAKPHHAIILPPTIKDLKKGKSLLATRSTKPLTLYLSLIISTQDPKVFRQYVAYIATTTPSAPSHLKGSAVRDWQDTQLRCVFPPLLQQTQQPS